jgi:HlyD family type I secretion membrane fusion protein
MTGTAKHSKPGRTGDIPKARSRFIAQAIQLEEQGIGRTIKVSIYSIVGLMLAIVAWMSVTEVSEVTVAGGKVIPVGHIHNIQHLEGGILGNILVQDGDRVEAGDLLVSFSPPASQSEFDQLAIRQVIMQLDLERLAALKAGREPKFVQYAQAYPKLADKAAATLRTQLASFHSELDVVDARIEQRMTEIQMQKNQVTVLEREADLLREQVAIRQELAARQAVSKADLLTMQSQHAAVLSDLRSAKDSVLVAANALHEEHKRREEIVANHEQEIEREAAKAESQLAEVERTLVRAKDKVDRLHVYAPVTGIVQDLSFTTINAVVQPGEVMMQIVPVDDEMMVESRVMPDEVGYIHMGQKAEVRVDSYDSSRHGAIVGSVRQISPSTYLDENANPYYKVKVKLDKSWLGAQPGQMTVIPGMTVQVDIITGSKTIMAYLLKPVSRGFQSAFQQR